MERVDCHGPSGLAMTGMEGVAMPQTFTTMPKTFVIASEARQSTGRMDCHGPAGLAMTLKQRFHKAIRLPVQAGCSILPARISSGCSPTEKSFSKSSL
jgi:hypothetical protein